MFTSINRWDVEGRIQSIDDFELEEEAQSRVDFLSNIEQSKDAFYVENFKLVGGTIQFSRVDTVNKTIIINKEAREKSEIVRLASLEIDKLESLRTPRLLSDAFTGKVNSKTGKDPLVRLKEIEDLLDIERSKVSMGGN